MNRHLRDIFAWFIGAVVCPFVDFVARMGWLFIAILLFVAVFRISDVMMQSMTSKVYVDLGFPRTKWPWSSRLRFFMTLVGAFLGGILVARHGIRGTPILAAIMIAGTNLFYALVGHCRSQPLCARHHDLCGQYHRRFGGHDLHRVSVGIDQQQLHGDAVRAFLVAHDLYRASSSAVSPVSWPIAGFLEIDSVTNATLNPEAYSNFFVFVSLAGIPSIFLRFTCSGRRGQKVRRRE